VIKFLAVDDDPALVNLLKESLEGEGYQIDTAFDGATALDKIAHARPDALVMDVNMPGLNGPQVLARLRSNPATVSLPVLFLTGESAQQVTMAASDVRVACLEKPVDLELLSTRLRQLLKP